MRRSRILKSWLFFLHEFQANVQRSKKGSEARTNQGEKAFSWRDIKDGIHRIYRIPGRAMAKLNAERRCMRSFLSPIRLKKSSTLD